MSLISRKCLILSKHAKILKPLFTVPKNTFFKEFEVKLERFNLVKKEYERKNLSLVEQKTKVQEYLTKNFQPDLLFESINPIIYLGNKDEDISLILDALKKLNSLETGNYKIHATFIRLLYTLDKIDLAIEYFKDESLRKLFMQDLSSTMLILDNLIESKRYDDVIRFFEIYIVNLDKIPSSILNAITLSLLKINSNESYEKLKKFVDFSNKRGFIFGVNSVAQIVMFSVLKKDYFYGIEFLSKTGRVHQNLYNNLIAIIFSCLDQTNEALKYAEACNNVSKPKVGNLSQERFLFKTTLSYLREAVGRSSDKALDTKLSELEKKLVSSKRVKNEDLIEFYSQSTEGIHNRNITKKII